MPERKDYYGTLGVDKKASEDEIRKAYRRLARKYHPDLNPGDKAAEDKFKTVQEAYDILSEPKKRAMFDQYGFYSDNGFPPGGPPPGGGPGMGFEGFDFSDFVKNTPSTSTSGRPFAAPRSASASPARSPAPPATAPARPAAASPPAPSATVPARSAKPPAP